MPPPPSERCKATHLSTERLSRAAIPYVIIASVRKSFSSATISSAHAWCWAASAWSSIARSPSQPVWRHRAQCSLTREPPKVKVRKGLAKAGKVRRLYLMAWGIA